MNNDRRLEAKRVRDDATLAAFNRPHPEHLANGDEQRLAGANYAMSFTKGLDHCPDTGLIKDKGHFEAFRQAIDNGVIEPFTTRVSVPSETITVHGKKQPRPRRMWEAPTAGIAFDLEGPDPQAVTMAPAPELGSAELDFEMAEVYELALLRDVPFFAFDADGGPGAAAVNDSIDRLNALPFAANGFQGRPRKTNNAGQLDLQTVFRGSAPGADVGPYLSQFLIIGNDDRTGLNSETDGMISYGAQTIDQRVPEAKKRDDFMVTRSNWLDVQQGFAISPTQNFERNRRFIATPRDLATYVHFDALYQAYLNACLILLSNGTPFDPAFDNLSGPGSFEVLTNAATGDSKVSNAGGFALYGGPHILTLVTEVATRALKAVRFQKFNNHIRGRPEALAGRLEYAKEIDKQFPSTCGAFSDMRERLKDTTDAINAHNRSLVSGSAGNTVLLPMAFAEGSPMHPAYGAGHATVAGACVTILKAFFDTSAVFAKVRDPNDGRRNNIGFFGLDAICESRAHAKKGDDPVEFVQFQVSEDGSRLREKDVDDGCPLTLEGELNKLAANISIGRNMAGVHYFSDYYDSVRMGEKIAIGMLEEQALCYPTDPFVMSVPTFDGEVVRIGAR